jgi:hypothetical protein
MFLIKSTFIICAVFLGLFGAVKFASADTHYMPSGCANLQTCFSQMSSGDTLVVADGTYIGDVNQLRYNVKPPSGSVSAYTVVKAEHPGKVKFDGQNARSMFYGYGTFNMQYVQFDGFQYVNSNGGHDLTGAAHNNRTANHIKIIRCGFEDNLAINYASYILIEDCYVTGAGRYNFIAFTSDHVIFRRCVARLDSGNGGGMPIAHFADYTSQSVEFQNCIAIDSDDSYYSNYEGAYGGIYFRKCNTIGTTDYCSTDGAARGNIILNVKHNKWGTSSPGEALAIGYGASNLTFENNIYWDMLNGMVIDNGLDSNYTVKHSLFGKTASGSYPDALLGSNSYGDISNSIFYGIYGKALNDTKSSVSNNFYANGTDEYSVTSSTGKKTLNPLTNGLKYLPRIEVGTALKNAGSDGGDIGPEVLKKIGGSGTLYGDPGYNTTTNEALWPWPNEDIIKSFFTSPDIGNTPIRTRGFCAGTSRDGSPQTLTKYIWEYLGNQIPSEIYGNSGDTIAPASPGGLSVR